MDSISIQPEDRLEGTSNFNTWKARVFNILEEHDLEYFVTSLIEEPTSNAGRKNYKKNQEKEKRIIYDSMKDNLMSVITPLKMKKECFDTLTNIYEKKPPTQKRDLKNKMNVRDPLGLPIVILYQIYLIMDNKCIRFNK